MSAFFYDAPGKAQSLGGGSPLLARQGDELAERQGCREHGKDGVCGALAMNLYIRFFKP